MASLSLRVEWLDALRGVAIIPVMLRHYLSRFTPPDFRYDLYGYQSDITYNFRWGGLGVELFFVISGFVIFHFASKEFSIREFLSKRIARLLPPLVFCSIVTFAIVNMSDIEHL